MITLRKASERGRKRLDWLDSRHTFSFGDYFDPRENGFSVLRVVNDDRVAGGGGFSTHAHRDSLGTRSLIPAGDLQRMTAGTGITHSEFNPSPSNPLHFLQIWISPERPGLKPGYDQKSLGPRTHNVLSLVASSTGHDDLLTVHQDINLYIGTLDSRKSIDRAIAQSRKAYLHVARGKVVLNDLALDDGDGAKISGDPRLSFSSPDQGEILLFDLP